MSSTYIWYTARAAGLTAWVLLACTVIWGLVRSTGLRPVGRRIRPAWVVDLHRFLGGLTAIFVVVHVGAILLDTYVPFSLESVLVPGTSSWHPVATAWGTVALYLLAAVELTSLARKRLPPRLWRKVHYLSLPLFAFATVHGLTAGTDRSTLAVLTGAVVGCSVVAGLVAHRVARARPASPPRPPAGPVPPAARPPATVGG